ncbi:LacI family DNA-binding transcriptional regulator [Phytohabitans aurantiacus]|jgi:LacI family transcriptional regulator|uniref:LacI family transcriptional regulator n=1 Tax=Phytohabitans aurantiacus TaxID=3016789 RepID=A0ABQ5R480_9ACTN|nr:LacI family DNA-binding transcriptional regulator [Phytohabitans aurantiacus]GLI01594.1 LacI family transcriptional regulator [Phytohabitans aurantiacus]
MSSRRPTLRDVSSLAGVSAKTVSRVINDDPAVAPGTAEKVQAAIRELGFFPNPVARSLRVGRDDAVGLVVENIADPFFAEVTSAVEEVARERGMFVVIASAGYAPENERVVVDGLTNRRVAGLIITPTSGDHSYLGHGHSRLPTVFVDRPPIQHDADTVLADNEGGARLATRHLIDHGHRRVAFIGDRLHIYTTRLRYQGFRAAMLDAGLQVDERLVRVDAMGAQNSTAATVELLTSDPNPTAVISANARTSLGVVKALHQEDRTDIAHVSFDDFQGAESLNPPVTAVYQDPQALGRQAAELLFDRLNGDDTPPRRVVLPVRLIVRGSGELPPAPMPTLP